MARITPPRKSSFSTGLIKSKRNARETRLVAGHPKKRVTLFLMNLRCVDLELVQKFKEFFSVGNDFWTTCPPFHSKKAGRRTMNMVASSGHGSLVVMVTSLSPSAIENPPCRGADAQGRLEALDPYANVGPTYDP
ncbi:hypothetical protein TNCV_4245831 [Trichonephila clavipes]|nr:hypothetical protein TNCV_4245831 [Trichonephila clavipes]